MTLWQFQCQREGSLFYYQHGFTHGVPFPLRCPVCGSKRTKATGRTYPDVDESAPIPED